MAWLALVVTDISNYFLLVFRQSFETTLNTVFQDANGTLLCNQHENLYFQTRDSSGFSHHVATYCFYIYYFKPLTWLPLINLKKTKDGVAHVETVSVKACFGLAKNGARALAPFLLLLLRHDCKSPLAETLVT